MVVYQDYSDPVVREATLKEAATATIDTGADYVVFHDATDGQFKRTLASALAGGGGVTDGNKGDVTVASSGTVWTLNAGVVSTTEMGGDVTAAGKSMLTAANAAAQRTLLGTDTSSDTRNAHGVVETGGPTVLTMGAVADGEYLRRSGPTVVGDTPSGGSGLALYESRKVTALRI